MNLRWGGISVPFRRGFCMPAHARLIFAGGVLRLLPGYMLWIPQRTASIGDTED